MRNLIFDGEKFALIASPSPISIPSRRFIPCESPSHFSSDLRTQTMPVALAG
jgi:hypothetical protein